MRKWTIAVASVVLGMLLLSVSPVLAQDAGGGNPQGGNPGAAGNNNGGRRGNFDPAQMRQRIMDTLKEQMGATDDEWKALQPRVEKVWNASRETRAGGMGGMFGGGRRGGNPAGGADQPQQPQTPVAKASADLRSALDDKSISADEITKRLKALRDAKAKAKEEYEASAKELKELLTARQEAVLVMMGILE